MRQFTSEAAKSLITIIGTEYAMAQKRVSQRFVKPDAMLGTLFERLNRLACNNINLRRFLDNIGYIPVEEDENMDLDWANDPREYPDETPRRFVGIDPETEKENEDDSGEAYPFQIPIVPASESRLQREDEPYDDGKPALKFPTREANNVLTKRASKR